MSRYGGQLTRELRATIAPKVATQTALKALAVDANSRIDGVLTAVAADPSLWQFDNDSTQPAGPTVLVPGTGSGRWLQVGGGGGVGVGAVNISTVRGRTTAALAANTRVGNVLTADANGALGAIDGLTYTAGQRLLVFNEVTALDNGPHVVTDPGGAGPYILTRTGEADASAEVTAGMLHYVSEGTLHGDKWAYLTTDDDIVLNTTALDYAMVPQAEELAATTVGLGGDLIGLYDVGGIVTATTCGAAIIENRTALDVVEADVVAMSPGAPMQGRLIGLGAPAKLVQGDTVTIGADVYEFRDDTPPTGGTAARIWIYNGADSLASRTNLAAAINGGALGATQGEALATENMLAAVDPVTAGHLTLVSAVTPGGAAAPSATATAVSETLTTVTDVWDSATLVGGYVQAETARAVMKTVTVLAQQITAGTVEFEFDFTPTQAVFVGTTQPVTDESWAIVGNAVSLTLAGGAAPNVQANDVLTCIAQG